ncbi:f5c222c3-aed0-4596-9a65-58e4ce525f5c [Sclerotinia trifoliorum]|uniref:F5c222c3-aed0-4596-9a65-58e4ce525f5c n=1 Tax=Sclerotinia trifoliorum TaxID=28548 RepID=A0A8H2VRN4_9HELO|nr:f5c222c3-aed0-4596-9a65-58e4ce525f5c [Sclerotinia trifoliorum]
MPSLSPLTNYPQISITAPHPQIHPPSRRKMSAQTNVAAIVALFLIFLTIFLIYMAYPRNICHRLKARRIAAQKNRTSIPPAGQLRQDRDLEMNKYPLRYPDPVITTGNDKLDDWPLRNPIPPPAASILARRSLRSEDWPLRTIEPVVVVKRRQFMDPDEDDLKFGGAGGSLEGFPYRV